MTMKLVNGVLTPLTAEEQAEYDARQNVPPATPVPFSITNAQARYVFRRTPYGEGTLFDAVDAAVRATGGDIVDFWDYANEFERDSAAILGLAAALSITSAQLDDLFRTAKAVKL